MVRVLSIPLFRKQNVNCIERSVSTCCVALPNKLLVASSSTHCIEVNDIDINDTIDFDEDNTNYVQSPTFSFPTVDSVKQIIHSLHGNYIATIETKSNTRQNRTTSYVRVYANWDNVATLQQSKMNRSGVSLSQSECGMVQPMRARIAGRVTPSVTQSGDVSSLEMIEIPTKRTPNLIACCQITGNLLIASEQRLTIYKCIIKIHDTSKQPFLDFELVPQFFELNFIPTRIALTESYITAFNTETFFVFKILPTKLIAKRNNNRTVEKNNFSYAEDICIDYGKLCENELSVINLPMISKENVLMYKNLPFVNSRNITVTIKSSSPIESTSQSFEIYNVLQLKIRSDINVEGVIHQVSEEFSCFAVKPIYINENNVKLLHSTNINNKGINKHTVESERKIERNPLFLDSFYYKNLQTLVFMIATSQEGYLFHFDTSEICEDLFKEHNFELENKNLVGVYSFTTPVIDIVLEDTIVHALTLSGLESYTLKPPSRICAQNDPIYLIDLKSFLGVKQLLKTEQNLILLANYDGSPVRSSNSSSSSSTSNWTLYTLEMPSVSGLNRDILKTAEFHRKDSIQTYLHLLNKSYILLHLSVLLLKFEIKWDGAVGVVSAINKSINDNSILEEFRTTCMLLGDYYIMSQNYNENKQCIYYYRLADLMPTDILKRFLDLEKSSNDSKVLQGLLYYLKTVILDVKFGQDADDMFTPIPDSSHYVHGIINYFKINSNSNSFMDSESTDNYSLPHNSSDNSPFCSSKNLLTDQEMSGPSSLLITENFSSDVLGDQENADNLNNVNNQCALQSCSPDLLLSTSPEPNFNQTFADLALDIFNMFHPSEVANFVIKNAVIREYATNKIINILCQRNQRTAIDNFALTLLYLQKNEIDNAKMALEQCCDDTLMSILLKNPNLLFDLITAKKIHGKNIAFSDLTTLLITTKSEFLADVFFNILTMPKKSITLREIIKIFVEYLPSHVGESSASATNVFHITLEKYLMDYFAKLKDFTRPIIDNIIRESLKLLCRCYISKLIATNLCQTTDKNSQMNVLNNSTRLINSHDLEIDENFLFKTCRYKYLEKIPVFDMFCPVEEATELTKKQSIYSILIKLEAMLCSNILPQSSINEIDIFLKNRTHFIGKIRLQSIILPLNESTDILVDRYPMCLKLFAQERFSSETHWQHLILGLEKQIALLESKGLRGRQKLRLIKMARRDILVYLATNYSFERFLKTLPLDETVKDAYLNDELNDTKTKDNGEFQQTIHEDDYNDNFDADIDSDSTDDNDYDDIERLNICGEDQPNTRQKYGRYIELCKNSGHANQIQQFIIATGQQLLTTLNL